MVYLFLAEGFEEIEALCPLDLLRRAGADVKTVGVTGAWVKGSHGITVQADIACRDIVLDESLEMVIFPGGMPGTTNLENSKEAMDALDYAYRHGVTIAAICAAPSIPGKRGYLSGRNAVCFPGFEKYLTGANISEKSVVTDENFITGKGMGAALPFGLALVESLYGPDEAEKLRANIQAK